MKGFYKSNPFLLGMLKRLNKETEHFEQHPYDVFGYSNKNVSNDMRMLTEQIRILLDRAKQQLIVNMNIAKQEKTILYAKITEQEINSFFEMNDINDELKLVKRPLVTFIKESRIKNQLPELLLTRYIKKATDLIDQEKGGMNNQLLHQISTNISYLGHVSFADIMRDRNAIARYSSYQRGSVIKTINYAFNISTLVIKMLFNPFKYWNRQSFRLLRLRVHTRKKYIQALQYNRNLTEAALNQTIDNFFHRWLYCTSVANLNHISDKEKDTIIQFLSQKEVCERIKRTRMIPPEVKAHLQANPYDAFVAMVNINESRLEVRLQTSANEALIEKTLQFDDKHYQPNKLYPPSLLDMLQALIHPEKAKLLYGERMAIADGVIKHTKPKPLARRSKRLVIFSDYKKIFEETQAYLDGQSYDFSFVQNTLFEASFYQLIDDMTYYVQKNDKLLNGTKEGKQVKCVLDKILKGLKKIPTPETQLMEATFESTVKL